ncbi:MAG: 2-oxo acid dehydrogenase subunit E2, partial [Chlamydiae bacterium]|nr:2-oxo acid dehydrogenase subunit E2 [Chlamydiota bacterium]
PPVCQEAKKEPEAIIPAQDKVQMLGQPAFVPEPALEGYRFPFPEEACESIKATPYAKKLAKEQGIDLWSIKGSGPRQRISSRDLELGQKKTAYSSWKKSPPEGLQPGSYEEQSMSPMRRVIAERLQQAKSFIPHFYLTQKVRAESLLALRQQLKAGDMQVTINDLMIRATALALREHPGINSGFNSVTRKKIQFQTIDISVAVSVDQGLITPILRLADYKQVNQISVEMRLLAKKAKEGRLTREEYVGGSFTISNLGMLGISQFFGIINPPQAAILCVAGIEEVPVVSQGVVVPGKVMTLSLSADHRVIDGADGAKFLRTVQHLLENPALLLL